MSASLAQLLAMAPQASQQPPPPTPWGWMSEALPQIAAGTCLVMLGTCVQMWGTQQLIQQGLQTLVKSDAEQTRKIEKLGDDLNNVRIEQGVFRARLIGVERRASQ
jgi:hypothetical protein